MELKIRMPICFVDAFILTQAQSDMRLLISLHIVLPALFLLLSVHGESQNYFPVRFEKSYTIRVQLTSVVTAEELKLDDLKMLNERIAISSLGFEKYSIKVMLPKNVELHISLKLDAVVNYKWKKFELEASTENLLNATGIQTAFDTEVRPQNEALAISDFIRESPLFIKGGLKYSF
jgi:hypothetical protein